MLAHAFALKDIINAVNINQIIVLGTEQDKNE
jgi:hypothetical protein